MFIFQRVIRSLKWRLQAWQAAILLLVICGFGSTLYLQVRQSTTDEIDAELLSGARVLEGSLRAFPPPVLEGRFPAPPRRGPGQRDFRQRGRPIDPDERRPPPPPPRPVEGRGENLADDFDSEGERFRRPPPPPFPDDFPPPGPLRNGFEEPMRMLNLPFEMEARYRDIGTPPYFVIWRSDGSVLKSAGIRGELPLRPVGIGPERVYRLGERGIREIAVLGPGQTTILVGRSVEREQADLNRLAGQLVATGLGTLTIGLVGGWWLSSRGEAD